MVQEKTHIEVIAQVDLEPNAVLLNHFALVLVFHSNVLLSLSGAVSLSTSCAKVHPIFRDIEPLPNLKAYSLEVFTFCCWIAPVSGARKCPDHGIPFGSRILGIHVGKPVDDEWEIRNVPLVQTKASDSLLGTPAAEMTHPIRESCCKQLWFNLSISLGASGPRFGPANRIWVLHFPEVRLLSHGTHGVGLSSQNGGLKREMLLVGSGWGHTLVRDQQSGPFV